MSTFRVELKKVVDDSYEVEVGYDLTDHLMEDLKSGLVGKITKFAVITDSIVKELYANVKTSGKAGGKADVFLKGLSVTDEVEGEIPVAVAIGQNNLTGAITMRNYVDNHGDEKVRYGHYKNDDYYYVDSAQ